MDAAFVDFSAQEGWLITKFPIASAFLNPYGAMQGGMLAAAVDNPFGPLSLLVAPPNVTRRLEMKYSRPVTPAHALLYQTADHDYREAWMVPASDPDGNWTIMYTADYDGTRGLGYAGTLCGPYYLCTFFPIIWNQPGRTTFHLGYPFVPINLCWRERDWIRFGFPPSIPQIRRKGFACVLRIGRMIPWMNK